MEGVTGLAASLVGLSLVAVGWLHYLWLIPRERVPARPLWHALVIGLGVLAGVGGGVVSALGAPSVFVFVNGAAALVVGGFFFYLLRIAALPDGDAKFAVGERFPSFTATTGAGERFDSSSLTGQRVLLKFFRGHW
jgi:hypothetical protein